MAALRRDQNIEYQQNPTSLPIPGIILLAASNRIEALRPLIPELLQALARVAGPKFVRIPQSR